MRGISYFLEDLSEYKYQLGNADRSVQVPNAKQQSDVQATDPQNEPPRGPHSQPTSTASSEPTSISPAGNSSIPEQADTRHTPRFSRDSDSRDKAVPDPSKDSIRRIFTQASQLLCQQAKATGCVFTDAASGLFSSQPEGLISAPDSADPSAAFEINFSSTEDEETDADNTGRDDIASLEYGSNLSQTTFGDRLDEMADILSTTVTDNEEEDCRQGIIKRKNLKKFILRYPFGKCFYLNKGRVVSDQSLILDEMVAGGGAKHSALNTSIQDIKDQPQMLLPENFLTAYQTQSG